jgi:hypothetical protein
MGGKSQAGLKLTGVQGKQDLADNYNNCGCTDGYCDPEPANLHQFGVVSRTGSKEWAASPRTTTFDWPVDRLWSNSVR